jgi:hypothetical protein
MIILISESNHCNKFEVSPHREQILQVCQTFEDLLCDWSDFTRFCGFAAKNHSRVIFSTAPRRTAPHRTAKLSVGTYMVWTIVYNFFAAPRGTAPHRTAPQNFQWGRNEFQWGPNSRLTCDLAFKQICGKTRRTAPHRYRKRVSVGT